MFSRKYPPHGKRGRQAGRLWCLQSVDGYDDKEGISNIHAYSPVQL
jgi:hypothetical protein